MRVHLAAHLLAQSELSCADRPALHWIAIRTPRDSGPVDHTRLAATPPSTFSAPLTGRLRARSVRSNCSTAFSGRWVLDPDEWRESRLPWRFSRSRIQRGGGKGGCIPSEEMAGAPFCLCVSPCPDCGSALQSVGFGASNQPGGPVTSGHPEPRNGRPRTIHGPQERKTTSDIPAPR